MKFSFASSIGPTKTTAPIAELLRAASQNENGCNLGARHRWGIESGFLVGKHQGYQYEHCFSYDWQAMRGYHYLMRLGHALNILARYSNALANYVRDLGARGLIEFVRSTIAGLWLKPEDFEHIASAAFQIRLE